MSNVKVSVIIPVYNAEKYLEQCLDSVINQTLKEIEIICINDGSSDSSLDILERYQTRDNRIHVYSQKNAGLGTARNTGMKYVSGEYMAFLDSDDFYMPEALEKTYVNAKEGNADVCVFGTTYYREEYQEESKYDVLPNKTYLPEKEPFNISDMPDYILNFAYNVVWNKIYRLGFLKEHDIQSPLNRRGQDLYFTHMALCLADRITVIREPLITYRYFRQDSLSMTVSENPDDIIESWFITAEKLKAKGVYPEQSYLNNILGSLAKLLWTVRSSWPAFEAMYNRLKGGDLEKLGLVPREPGYYYNTWQEQMLENLFQKDAREFLLSYVFLMEMKSRQQDAKRKTREKKLKEKLEQQKIRINELKEKTNAQKEQIGELKAKEKEQKEQIGELKARAKEHKGQMTELKERTRKQSAELKARIQEQTEQIKALKREKQRIQASRSYRIGRMITWLPRKIRNLIFHG